MKKQKIIIVLVLAMFTIVLSCKGKDKPEITNESIIQNATNLLEKNNNTQKSEKTKSVSESSTAKLYVDPVNRVSIIQLIANPEKFNGKLVGIVGFVSLEFEGDAIYIHETDYKYGLTRNALWLSLTEGCCGKDRQRFDKKYVLVEGTFNAKDRGHMSLASGSIENIIRLQEWIVPNRK